MPKLILSPVGIILLTNNLEPQFRYQNYMSIPMIKKMKSLKIFCLNTKCPKP